MAAGLGFKTFTTGEVLTAADVNGYLMQGLLVFANAAARDAAITSPQEGQACYLKDTDAVLTYSGTAWVGFDDSNAIQNSIINAKGDLIAGSANDTPAILAAGNNGETLVADSAAATGLRYNANYAAGKNKFINGDMSISQRGTSFTIAASGYALDRFNYEVATAVPTGTVSQQTFTPGTAPVSPYEAQSFLRVNITANAGCTVFELRQKIEDVRTFAGQAITFSFYAKADAASNIVVPAITQNFGSGGSGSVTTSFSMNSVALTTGWLRYTGTVTVPSISGKTVGSSSFLSVAIQLPVVSSVVRNGTYDFWGWQLEAGPVATAFQTATGTLQGELAACQRYYETGESAIWSGNVTSGSNYYLNIPFAVVKRTNSPTITLVTTGVNGFPSVSTASINKASFRITGTANTTGSGAYIAADSWNGSAEL